MGDYHQYEPPSLAPLQITPAMMAQARAAQAAAPGSAAAPPPPPPMRTFQPTAPPNAGEDLNTLAAMFPDYDRDVISSVLAMSGGLDDAIQQLLEMGGGAPEDGIPGTQHQSDEELALALFKQFAEDLEQQLGRPIPADVRNDPVRYEAFVREHFERELARDGSQLSSRAMQMFASNYGADGSAAAVAPAQQEGFLERMRKMPALFGKGRVGMVNVADGAKPLLLSDYEGDGGSHSGRRSDADVRRGWGGGAQ